jgi:hypothetical protein
MILVNLMAAVPYAIESALSTQETYITEWTVTQGGKRLAVLEEGVS